MYFFVMCHKHLGSRLEGDAGSGEEVAAQCAEQDPAIEGMVGGVLAEYTEQRPPAMIPDFVRLLDAEDESAGGEDREVTVRWVDEPAE
jgi:hypothetical protein